MPTYDYKCPNCFRVDTHMHKISELKKIYCKDCRKHGKIKSTMIKQISSVPVHFKGTGFYETDYKGK